MARLQSPEEMPEFFDWLALFPEYRTRKSCWMRVCQIRRSFGHEMKQLAQQGLVRAFILFHQEQPVSYLYCPVYDGVLIYAFPRVRPRVHELFSGDGFAVAGPRVLI